MNTGLHDRQLLLESLSLQLWFCGFQIAQVRPLPRSGCVPWGSATLAEAGIQGCLKIYSDVDPQILPLGGMNNQDSQSRNMLSRRNPCWHLSINKRALLPPTLITCLLFPWYTEETRELQFLHPLTGWSFWSTFTLSHCWQAAQFCVSEALREELIQQ